MPPSTGVVARSNPDTHSLGRCRPYRMVAAHHLRCRRGVFPRLRFKKEMRDGQELESEA